MAEFKTEKKHYPDDRVWFAWQNFGNGDVFFVLFWRVLEPTDSPNKDTVRADKTEVSFGLIRIDFQLEDDQGPLLFVLDFDDLWKRVIIFFWDD